MKSKGTLRFGKKDTGKTNKGDILIPITITTMHDGSLFDIESYGQSICELLPTIYRVDIGNKTIQLSEEDNDFINRYGNATEVTIHMLCYKDDIGMEKIDF